MKILWCDDKASDDSEFRRFLDDWNLKARRKDVLRVTSDHSALEMLQKHADIRLVILDLFWGEPEHPSVKPMGIHILERIRKKYPTLRVVTRSVVDKPDVLSSLVRYFVECRIADHFVSHVKDSLTDMRKEIIIETAEADGKATEDGEMNSDLQYLLGDQWGVVLFADISGFTSVTEQLWHQNREALCNALKEFYDRAGGIVHSNGGMIDKFIGDELMAIFFHRPEHEKRHDVATKSIDAARELLNVGHELERRFKKALTEEDDAIHKVIWQLKIGMEAGSLHIMEQKLPTGGLEFCAVGRAINFASRIKGLAGPYSVTLGDTLKRKLPQEEAYQTKELEINTELKGITKDTPVFTLANP